MWRMSHLEFTASNFCRRNNLKIVHWDEVSNFQLTLACDRQRWRFYATNADYAARPLAQDDRRGASQREIVDLIGLPACDCSGVQATIL